MLYHISYYTYTTPFMNKDTVVTEYFFILLDANMVPITYYLTKNTQKKKKKIPIQFLLPI